MTLTARLDPTRSFVCYQHVETQGPNDLRLLLYLKVALNFSHPEHELESLGLIGSTACVQIVIIQTNCATLSLSNSSTSIR